MAVRELQKRLPRLAEGKMFGVLVVRNESGEMGYFQAYSGQMDGLADASDYVPPVFSYLQPDGYFKQEEARITLINHQIARLEQSVERQELLSELSERQKRGEADVALHRQRMTEAKQQRDERRLKGDVSPVEAAEMVRQSQFLKAEWHRAKKRFTDEMEDIKTKIRFSDQRISQLKAQRKQRSDALQNWLFSHFVMLNARGESRDLPTIFRDTVYKVPPSGAGECCEPKLLQYALAHHCRPLCMAMFWWGPSPRAEVRHEGHYYPACSGKCKPILGWMLQGLEVDNPSPELTERQKLEVVYEDESLIVVNKPAGMLSVPGRSDHPSVLSVLRSQHKDGTQWHVVHRLDMATSGLMVVAKNQEAHRNLQHQFAVHTIRKRYAAILSRPLVPGQGTLTLPLSPDPLDRPRQKVDFQHGRRAITYYNINKVEDGKTWITLQPLTGRTHQLRVHCSHHDGLNAPICGDTLYGCKADRLYLHAEYLAFVHPATGQKLHFERKAPWKG